MNIEIGKTALITTDCYFLAPNGYQYRAVFGLVKSVKSSEDSLGIKTNARSTNWYVEIGNMLLAGCQIHYAIRSNRNNINFAETKPLEAEAGKQSREVNRDSYIYDAGD